MVGRPGRLGPVHTRGVIESGRAARLVQGWEPPPAVGEDWPHCGEIIAVSPERVEVDWSGEGKFTLVRDIIVK